MERRGEGRGGEEERGEEMERRGEGRRGERGGVMGEGMRGEEQWETDCKRRQTRGQEG